ncbi:unnamed protein product [Sphagnum jensenii]|uniref:Uncharacterized protein n=1 Tax=Sphagnum jensenii TaxID=128206 RepID=A0ABP1A8C2_9BRYO
MCLEEEKGAGDGTETSSTAAEGEERNGLELQHQLAIGYLCKKTLQKDVNPFQKDGFTVLWWQQLARGVDFTLDKLSWKFTELSEELSDGFPYDL